MVQPIVPSPYTPEWNKVEYNSQSPWVQTGAATIKSRRAYAGLILPLNNVALCHALTQDELI